jgi:hypothetical protein
MTTLTMTAGGTEDAAPLPMPYHKPRQFIWSFVAFVCILAVVYFGTALYLGAFTDRAADATRVTFPVVAILERHVDRLNRSTGADTPEDRAMNDQANKLLAEVNVLVKAAIDADANRFDLRRALHYRNVRNIVSARVANLRELDKAAVARSP